MAVLLFAIISFAYFTPATFEGRILYQHDSSAGRGAGPRDCGNYLLHDLPMAKWESRKFLTEVLENIKPENLVYPE